MKGNINPELKKGDRIVLYHMEGEITVPPGTEGEVISISRDPFEKDQSIISVKWDNGSTLSLLSQTDFWKKAKEKIEEQIDPNMKFVVENNEILKHFDWRYLRSYLAKLRESGIVNMFGSSPLLYSGKEHIDRYYGEKREDDNTFQELLDMADTARNKIIQGVISYMKENEKDLDNMDMVNKYAKNFAQKILGMYIALSNLTGRVD